jgi:hypothetical protein
METIKIEKFKNKFTVKSKYDADLLEIIRKIEARYWSSEKLEWYLPIAALEGFIEELNKLENKQKYQIKIIDSKPFAFIAKNTDTYELKFASFVDNFAQFKNIPNVKYDKDTRTLIIPDVEYDKMMSLLKELDFDYSQENKEEKKEDKGEKKQRTKRALFPKNANQQN